MQRDEVISRLKDVEPTLRARGVGGLYLFGSVGRDEAKIDSDIDIFVDVASDCLYELGNFTAVYRCISETFPGVAIGYSTREGLSTHVRREAEREAVKVF